MIRNRHRYCPLAHCCVQCRTYTQRLASGLSVGRRTVSVVWTLSSYGGRGAVSVGSFAEAGGGASSQAAEHALVPTRGDLGFSVLPPLVMGLCCTCCRASSLAAQLCVRRNAALPRGKQRY